jgi:hypothetical protein
LTMEEESVQQQVEEHRQVCTQHLDTEQTTSARHSRLAVVQKLQRHCLDPGQQEFGTFCWVQNYVEQVRKRLQIKHYRKMKMVKSG